MRFRSEAAEFKNPREEIKYFVILERAAFEDLRKQIPTHEILDASHQG